MAKNESVTIRNNQGKRICQIWASKWWENFISTPTLIPFIWETRVTIWSNPEAIIKYAWFQSYSIVQYIKEPYLIRDDTRCKCLACGEFSIQPKYLWPWNRKWTNVIGFSCQNNKCNMLNILFPITITTSLHEMPADIMADIVEANPLKMNNPNKMIIWERGR